MGWFRKSERMPPAASPANPGKGPTYSVAFANGERTWEEADDLVASLARTLRALGHVVDQKKTWIELEDLQLVPQIVSIQPLERGGVHTLSTIQVSHATAIPEGVFEFQHAAGDTSPASFASGFKNWAELDLPVYLDALRKTPKVTTTLSFEPGPKSNLSHARRVVLGPPQRMAVNPPDDADHPYCPCCFFTKNHEVLRELLDSTAFYGVRFFAMRNVDGTAEADCRVNGEDFEPGRQALVDYVKTWPGTGIESRKQYICIQ